MFFYTVSISSMYFSFFFLMIRRPPRSTLFPYNDALPIWCARRARDEPSLHGFCRLSHTKRKATGCSFGRCRSEEHTSELQSQSNLVCRLLLEKKKTSSDPTLTSIPTPSATRAHKSRTTTT